MVVSNFIKNLVSKVVKFNSSLGVFVNGENNDYSETMQRIKRESKTAIMASEKMTDFLVGKGFGDADDDIRINGVRVIDILRDMAVDLVDERGLFVHVNYNSLGEITSMKPLPFDNCRVGDEDDRNYKSKILVYPDWLCGSIDNKKLKVYDVFNPNLKVIESQVERDEGWSNYKGQVFYLNMDGREIYPLSRLDSIWRECSSERESSIYKHRLLKFGFFGKTLFITRPLVGKKPTAKSTTDEWRRYRDSQTELANFQKNASEFIGADSTGNFLHLQTDFKGEDLEKALVVKQIESKIDDKLFEYTDKQNFESICMIYKNLPPDLIKSSGSSIFGANGTMIKEMKRSYQENTEFERSLLERTFNSLFALTKEGKELGRKLQIIKLIADESTPDTTNE